MSIVLDLPRCCTKQCALFTLALPHRRLLGCSLWFETLHYGQPPWILDEPRRYWNRYLFR